MLLLLIPLFLAIAATREYDEIGKITFPMGEVKVSHAGSTEMLTAELNAPVYAKDKICTGKESRCEVTLMDGSVIRIGENSIFDFDEVKVKDKKVQGKAKLKSGSIWSNLIRLSKSDESVQIQTPTSVMAVRGTVFRTDAGADSATSVLVYEGAVDVNLTQKMSDTVRSSEKRKPGPPQQVSGPKEVPGPYEVSLDEWMRIVAGMQINVRKDGKFHSFKFDAEADAQIDWVKWNKERDQAVQR